MRWETYPPSLRERAGYLLLDTLGAGLAGRSAQATSLVRTLLPSGATQAQDMALILGTACQALDLDETNLPAGCHIAATIVPALAAASTLVPCSGARFMATLVTAYEFQGRLGRSLAPRHASRGWHSSATLGTFGAAFGVSLLLGLDEAGTRNALALAATQAAGVKAVFGGTAKPLNFGRAAQSGVISARLAQAGMTAPNDPFHAADGFFAAAGALPFHLEGRGDGHPLLDNHFKFLPFCIETHATALAVRKLLDMRGRPDRLRICLAPTARTMVDRPKPADLDQARFSVQYVVAATLAGEARSPMPSAFDENLLRNASPFEIVEDYRVPHLGSKVTAIYGDEELTSSADLVQTDSFDSDALAAKFDLLSRSILDPERHKWRDRVLSIEKVDTVVSVLQPCLSSILA